MTHQLEAPRRIRAQTVVLALMCGIVAMTVLDLAVVNVALPSIQADLHARAADLQWVVVVYGVVVAGCMMLGGRAGDLFGHRRTLVVGIGVLTAGSLLAGLAGTLGVLVAGRAAQGLGAAMATPNALGLLSRTFADGPERSRALGIFGAAGASAALAGSLVGGSLVQASGWQSVFFLNVPLGAALAALILLRVPPDEARAPSTRADVAGAVALTGGLVAITLGAHTSIGAGWGSPRTLALLLAGVALLVAFLAVESRSAAPLIPPGILRRRSLVLANVTSALLWAGFLGFVYESTLLAQQALGYTPLAAGASTVPIAILSIGVSARPAPWAIDRFGAARTLAIGLALLCVGFLLLARVPPDAHYAVDLLPAYAVVGAGIGFAQVAVQIAAFAGVDATEAGAAGGAVETTSEVGGAVGVAVLVSIALAGSPSVIEAFHRAIVGAAGFAAAGAVVAITLLRAAERGGAVQG